MAATHTAKLAFDPGTAKACGYSTHAFAHAALVCETVTGKPYDQFAIEALLKPLGIEHWWFQSYEGGPKYGRHPSHGMGMPARDMAPDCLLHDPQWPLERQAGNPEMVCRADGHAHPQRAWTGIAVQNQRTDILSRLGVAGPLDGRGRPERHGLPPDARSKPGSGGQLIAFVPSLDLVVTRQTGSGGNWQFEEYLRQACAAVVDLR